MAAGLRTVKYYEPTSGVTTVFYDDGSGDLTQAGYLCDPADPGTPLGTSSNPLAVSLEESEVTLADLQAALKTTNKLLFLILRKLERT